MSPSYPPAAVLTDHLGFNDLPELADVLLTHKKFRMIIEGSSMYPALQTGDLVDVERIAEDRLQVGDLILFWKEHQLICHRLVGLSEEDGQVRVRAKGDATGSEDAPLPVDQVPGRVCRIEGKEDLTLWSISHLFVRISYRCCGIATDLLTTTFAFLVGKECLSWGQR